MTDNAGDRQLIELKDLISELNKTIRTLQETLSSMREREAALKTERDNLKEQVDYLTKKLFGRSSEKNLDIPGQMSLFNEAELEQDPHALREEEQEASEETIKPRKRKTVMKDRFAGLPVRVVEADLPDGEKICSECGTPLERIGKEFLKREFHYVPARGEVIEYYSVNYKCPACSEKREIPEIIKGRDGRFHMIHGMASASTVAWVMYQKYVNCIPLYRQEADFRTQLGVGISRATMANWIISNSTDFFTPMYDFFRRTLLRRVFLMADETPVQVLKEPGRRAETKSYMWIFRTGEDAGPPVILYHYSETRAGDTAVNFLEDFAGYLMCDGYSGYNKVKRAKRTSCWAHVRRYLIDAVPKGKQFDYTQPAVQGLKYVQELFEAEEKIHAKYTEPDKIKKARLEKELPYLEGFWSWLEKQSPVRNSRLDKAVIYIRNRKPYLTAYLEDGRCSFTNNASERSVKPFVMGRKNWLFSDTPKGADASSKVYTMVETAKANGVNPYHYLAFLLEKSPSGTMNDVELESLAPWNEAVKAEITARSGKGIAAEADPVY